MSRKLRAVALAVWLAALVAPRASVAQTPPGRTQARPAASGLTIVVRNLRSDSGHVRAGLYRGATGWAETGTDIQRCVSFITRGVSRCTFRGVPAGNYGVALMHDQNDNRVMDKGLFDVPTEGWGFSRDADGGMSRPAYSAASFDYDGVALTIEIHARYVF